MLTDTHHKAPLDDDQHISKASTFQRLTKVNKARKDMSLLYPKLLVATPMVETMTMTSSIPYSRVLP
jgi:hypothetical protein